MIARSITRGEPRELSGPPGGTGRAHRSGHVPSSVPAAPRHRLGTAHDLASELDATLQSTLDGNLELSASCVLPVGAPQADRTRVYLPRDPGAVTRKSRLFKRSRLPEAPQRCTVTLELADRTGAIREPLLTKCCRDGALADGACA